MSSYGRNDPVNGYEAYFTEDSYKKLVKEDTFESKLSKSISSIKLQRQANHIVHGDKGNKSVSTGEKKGSNSAVSQNVVNQKGKKSNQETAVKTEVKSEPECGSSEEFVLPTSLLGRKIGGLQKKSSLTKTEQRKYIDLLLKYRYHPPGVNLSNTEKKDLKYFESLQVRVAVEQNEFMGKLRELAANQGIYNFLSPDGRRYIEEKHEGKLKQVEDLPRYFFTINKPLPLNVTINPCSPPPNLVFVKTLAELGVPAKISIPIICNNEKKMIPNDYDKVSSQCPMCIQTELENKYCKQVCSKDKNSEILACKTFSHIVLSTSVLRCLINNHAPNFNTAWEIPVTVKTHDLQYQGHTIKQKVVYFDKPLPPKEESHRDKNTKYHKYALRAFLARSQNKPNVKNKPNSAVPERKPKAQKQNLIVKEEDPFGDVSIDDIETFGAFTLTSKLKEYSKPQKCEIIKNESRVKSESSNNVSELNKDLFGSGSETDTPCHKNENSFVLEACSGTDNAVSETNIENESFSELSDSDLTDKECPKSSQSVSKDENGDNSACSQDAIKSIPESKMAIEENNQEKEIKMCESNTSEGAVVSNHSTVASNKDSVTNVPNTLECSTGSESEENLVIDLGDLNSKVKKRKVEQIFSPKGKKDENFLCNPKPTKVIELSKKDKNVPNRVPFAIFKQKWKLKPLTSDDLDQSSPVEDQNIVRLRSGRTVGNLSGDESSSSFSQSDSESVFTPPKKPRQMEEITSPDNISQSDCENEVPVKVIPLEKREYGQLIMVPKQPKYKKKDKSATEDNGTPTRRVLRSQRRYNDSHDQNEPIEMESLANEKLTSVSQERRKSPRIYSTSSDVDMTKDIEMKAADTPESTTKGGEVVKRKRGRPRKESNIKREPTKDTQNKESDGNKEPVDRTRPPVRRSLSLDKEKTEIQSNTFTRVTELHTEDKSTRKELDQKERPLDNKNKIISSGTPCSTKRKTKKTPETNKTTESNLLDDILGKTDAELEKKKAEEQEDYLEPIDGQISYHLWKFSGLSMIIRTYSHGMVRDARQTFQGHIVPKLEYQIKHGVEQISLEEVSQAWISCYVKPFSQLIRGRISATTSELLMIETLDLNQILSQATNFNVIGALCSLHNILMTVYSLENGTYLLSHEAGEAHCHIKQASQYKRGAYDLHFSHQGHIRVNEMKNEWFPIDTNIILPHHKVQGRIPATYEPEDFNTGNNSKKRKGGKKKKWNNKK
ncbi:hypothetical protein LOTGIDRAFT_237405 [Lottia gigantea]|uniref:Little elongation complex subunit 2 C-terminal domain-containing protein n=1 Tax=Lottia gigantea TaxID=225164 RepID=V4BEP5_LOTGI|nr:hypothetical protein LOTGIDRAFT_237405 [Lottia gigantea]ESP04292.1 hypothetical protein LOTGIDRAFT_237405 [Lottia gigantea]